MLLPFQAWRCTVSWPLPCPDWDWTWRGRDHSIQWPRPGYHSWLPHHTLTIPTIDKNIVKALVKGHLTFARNVSVKNWEKNGIEIWQKPRIKLERLWKFNKYFPRMFLVIIAQGCARFPDFCKILDECQILWSLCPVVFLAFTLKLPIQTLLSVAPEHIPVIFNYIPPPRKNCQNLLE